MTESPSFDKILKNIILIVDPRECLALLLYHREASGKWTIINYQADDIVDLASIGLQFPIAQIYRNLTLTPDSP